MAWIAITTGSIRTAISDAEYDKYTNLSTGSYYSGAEIVQNTITSVTNMVRSYVAGCPRNQLDTDTTTIPALLEYPAISIIIYRIMQRLAGKIADISEARKKEYEEAMKLLNKVSMCEMGIDKPTNPASDIISYNNFYGTSETQIQF